MHANDNTTPAVALLLLLLCADGGFILLHLTSVETGWLREARISLEADGGPAEFYQYVKELWVVVCMAFAFVSTRYAAYASWAFVFLLLLVDDATKVHEQVGAWLGHRYALPGALGLPPEHIGELLFAGAIGTFMLSAIGVAVWRAPEQSRRISRDMLCLTFVLALAGIFIDGLHVISYFNGSLLAQVLLVVEDGGEMIVMSALTAYAFHVATHLGRTRFDLWSPVRARLLGSVAEAASKSGPEVLNQDSRTSRGFRGRTSAR